MPDPTPIARDPLIDPQPGDVARSEGITFYVRRRDVDPWGRCPCRPATPWTPPPVPDRSPATEPRPLDVVDTRRVVAVEADAVSWDTPVPYGARTYTDGTWERARWERWARRQWVRRWAEDWTVPAWMRPIVGRPRR